MTEEQVPNESACSEGKNRGQFKKGASGNPGGRPKMVLADGRSLRDVAMAHTEDAVAVLAQVMNDKNAPKASRVSAATAILDRGWGRPVQELQVERPTDGTQLAGEQRQARIDSIIQIAIQRMETRRRDAVTMTR